MNIKELDLAILTDQELVKLNNAVYNEQDLRHAERNKRRQEQQRALEESAEWQENEKLIKEYYAKRKELQSKVGKGVGEELLDEDYED